MAFSAFAGVQAPPPPECQATCSLNTETGEVDCLCDKVQVQYAPIPEPATFMLLSGALAATPGLRKRKQ